MNKLPTEIVVCGRDAIEEYTPLENEACISIRSHDPNHPTLGDSDREAVLKDGFVDVLRLQMDDVDPDVYEDHRAARWTPMTDEEALQVREFVEKNMYERNAIVVHCRHGVSRSRSMAAAICDQYNIKHDFVVYNKFVYDKVRNAFRTQKTT